MVDVTKLVCSSHTMSHAAPELLRYGRLSPAVDVYAFGIMSKSGQHAGCAAPVSSAVRLLPVPVAEHGLRE